MTYADAKGTLAPVSGTGDDVRMPTEMDAPPPPNEPTSQPAGTTRVTEYGRALGDELRRLRTGRGWTRKQLRAHLPDEVSLQTLATYEQGIRAVSVDRLTQLCEALGTRPAALLAAVDRLVYDSADIVTVDLRALAATTRPSLSTARQWASARLASQGTTVTAPVAELTTDALARLAELCALNSDELITELRPHTHIPRG